MVKYYLGLDEEQAAQIEDLRDQYEAELGAITASKFIRKLLFQGLEAVGVGRTPAIVVSDGL
tara:strand:- start:1168 stop:1353 length:186 start_codon:yes stop_codon:yes gene_type:complete